jgi:perosamine synthetase
VNTPLLSGNEIEYLIECIKTAWISSEGPFVKRFEEEFARKTKRRFGIAVCNGSVALDLAVAALEIGPGDEVILPSFTIISCAAAIIRTGAKPVLVDVDPDTWNMDINQIEDKITTRTKAIMVVHIYGLSVDMDPVLQLAEKYGLALIEDAAEAHGQNYKNRPCGSFGNISTFSFYPNKLVTTGEGGMLLTDDHCLAERCRSFRNLCFQPDRRFVHEMLGWNYRMSNIQAAVGVAQLEKFADHLEIKKNIGKLYTEGLSDIPGLQLPLQRVEYCENTYWVYGLVLKDEVPFDAAEAMKRLKEKGIGTRPFFWPMHEQPVFKKMRLFNNIRLPVSERIARKGFYIPSGLGLSTEDVKSVVNAVREVMS